MQIGHEEAKASLKLNLAKDVKEYKKVLQVRQKQKGKWVTATEWDGDPATVGAEGKAAILKALFASLLTIKASSQESLTQETREKVWRKEDFSLVKKDWVREYLGKLDIHNCRSLDGMQVLLIKYIDGKTIRRMCF